MNNKDNKTFKDSLKHFFRPPSKGSGLLSNAKNRIELTLNEEIERVIRKDAELDSRLKAFHELTDLLERDQLEDKAIEKLWTHVEDLLHQDRPKAVRDVAFNFLKALIKTQFNQLSLMRAHFFRVIKGIENDDDVMERFELFVCLTENGRNVLYFEDEIGPFVLKWMKNLKGFTPGKKPDFLLLLINVIKFNACYLGEDIITGVIREIYSVCCFPAVLSCLQVLNTIITYTYIPPDSLPDFIGILCHSVNGEVHCVNSWKVMKNLMGTHVGPSAIFILCNFLQEPMFSTNTLLQRGSIFFLNMALWGVNPIPALRIHTNTVLLCFLEVLKCKEQIIMFEIVLSVQKLLSRHGAELYEPVWDTLMSIIETVLGQINDNVNDNQKLYDEISKNIFECVGEIDNLIEIDKFNGSFKKYYGIVARNTTLKPKVSVLKLIDYLSSDIIPTKSKWIDDLKDLLQKFFREDSRTDVRLKVLDVLKNVFIMNRICFENELFDQVIYPLFATIHDEPDVVVKTDMAQFILRTIYRCNSHRCSDMLDVAESVLKRFFEMTVATNLENELPIVDVIVTELIELFLIKVYQSPASFAVRIFNLIVQHLHKQYEVMFSFASRVRYRIIRFLLQIRANSNNYIGFPQTNNIPPYSPFIKIDNNEFEWSVTPVMSSEICYVSLRKPFQLLVLCLKSEKNNDILYDVLSEIADLIQNRAIKLIDHQPDFDMLVVTLFSIVTDKTRMTSDISNSIVTRYDLQKAVFVLLANLTPFHTLIAFARQQSIIHLLLKFGLVSQHVKLCIIAITSCVLEMNDSIIISLPEILLDLSKTSPNTSIAIPVLEFLATLIRFPHLYNGFRSSQYMTIFAISVPYTNPFKYNHYTVSLAHHVIAVWFLKCQQCYRRDFVKFITTGLQTHILQPFWENVVTTPIDRSLLNEDSSHRRRSTSLMDPSKHKRDRSDINESAKSVKASPKSPTTSSPPITSPPKPIVDQALLNFYEESSETCIDFMARYTFSPCSALPKRSHISAFLLKNGNSQTWLYGNKIITVTTSGCMQIAVKNNLCERCRFYCKLETLYNNKRRPNTNMNTNTTDGDSEPEKIIETETKKTSSPNTNTKSIRSMCTCWCQGWAEIYIRRPTGDTAWTLRIQNLIDYPKYKNDCLLNDISSIFSSNLTNKEHVQDVKPVPDNSHVISKPMSVPNSPIKRCMTEQSPKVETKNEFPESGYDDDYDGKSRNPVRRSNSSPEMSATWKSHFLNSEKYSLDLESMQKRGKNYATDLRVSWEVIPEEIAGSTPPSDDLQENHQHLMVFHKNSSLLTTSQSTVKSNEEAPNLTNVVATISSLNLESRDTNSPIVVERPTSLPCFISRSNSINKPPESPTTQTWSKIAQSHLVSKVANSGQDSEPDISPISRDRGHTISVMSPARIGELAALKSQQAKEKEISKYSINPSFVFLQLYHSSFFGNVKEKPLLVASSTSHIIERSVKVLSCIPPFETHKVGIVYVAVGQCNNELEILRNRFGSVRYMNFLKSLGTIIRLENIDPQTCFLGGLECNGDHGKFAYIWQDDVVQVIFHVATLMPTKTNDPRCTNKKMHIGNNYVTIVYNDSGEEYNFGTIKGQFNYVSIVIVPLDHDLNKIIIKANDEVIEQTGFMEPRIISDRKLAILVRQLALHANLASMVSRSLKINGQEPFSSNWMERLRKIKGIRKKLMHDRSVNETARQYTNPRLLIHLNNPIEDFTSYTS